MTSSGSHFRSPRKRRMDASQFASVIREGVIPTISGCIAFGTTLSLSTCAQKRMGISTGDKLLARLAGVPTVCVASLISQRFTYLAQEWNRNPDILKDRKAVSRILRRSLPRREYYEISERIRLPKDDVNAYVTHDLHFRVSKTILFLIVISPFYPKQMSDRNGDFQAAWWKVLGHCTE